MTAIPCELDLDLWHFDIEQAFVHSDLEENVLLRLPQGYGSFSGKIVRLNKRLYGLKRASRPWHAPLARCLLTSGFVQCLADACVFGLMDEEKVTTIVVHVDGIFAVGEKARCDQFGGLGPNGSGLETGRAALVFGVFLREGLGEGGVEDIPADIR